MIRKEFSHYTIVERLGEGGMGEVYLARDRKLERLVALKFLSPGLADDDDEKKQLISEARSASALSHPNIRKIHDIVDEDGCLCIVMEYVEGRTLREAAQTLTLREIVDVGVQVATGLAAAHEKGIVHRDVKPENILLRKDGIAQLTDFGLAERINAGRNGHKSETEIAGGTYQYMSPEQVQGRDVDFRSDIFSLGVVLYELVSGEAPFKGWHRAAIEYEIINVDPPLLDAGREDVDHQLAEIVRECLEKERDERYQSALELAKDLKRVRLRTETRKRSSRRNNPGSESTSSLETNAIEDKAKREIESLSLEKSRVGGFVKGPSRHRGARIILLSLSFAGTVLLTALVAKKTFFTKSQPAIAASILAPAGTVFDNSAGSNFALSPDGSSFAFVASDSLGNSGLYLKDMRSMSSTFLAKVDNRAYPFWSPDNKMIAFFSDGKMMKMPASGGVPVVICDAQVGSGGTWNPSGTIIFSEASTGSLFKVSSSGGVPVKIISPDTDAGQRSLRWPYFLPDGVHFLFTAQTSASDADGQNEVFAGSLADEKVKLLLTASSNAEYGGGELFFMRSSVLMTQPFEPGRLNLSGEVSPLAGNIQFFDIAIRGSFTLSDNGILIYQQEKNPDENIQLLDLNHRRTDSLFSMPIFHDACISPDDRYVAFDSYDMEEKNYDIWTYDTRRNVPARLTIDPDADAYPCWSPHGREIVFSSNRGIGGNMNLFIKNSDGSGRSRPLFRFDNDVIADQWSPDGKYLAAQVMDYVSKNSGWDLILLPTTGGKAPLVFAGTKYDEERAQFSPGSKWILYMSNETGERQLYVASAAGTGSKLQVSVGGARWGRWVDGGRKIYYLSPDNSIMGVKVLRQRGRMSFSKPFVVLPSAKLGKNVAIHDITASGDTVLEGTRKGSSSPSTATVLSNWRKMIAEGQ